MNHHLHSVRANTNYGALRMSVRMLNGLMMVPGVLFLVGGLFSAFGEGSVPFVPSLGCAALGAFWIFIVFSVWQAHNLLIDIADATVNGTTTE